VFGVAGRQTGTGSGRHPEDQQGQAAVQGCGTDYDRRRRADRRLPVNVRTVRRTSCCDHRGGRRRSQPVASREQSDGHRAGGQAQAVHVHDGGVQPGILRGSSRSTVGGQAAR